MIEIMLIKIINSLLILFAVYMGFKQGWAMINLKPDMLEMFGKWNFSKEAVRIFGAVTVLSALLILFPYTFIWGNFLMAATILLLICLDLSDKDIKSAVIELPFFLLNLLIMYLQYPLTKHPA
jgi:DoxX-like protein